MPPKSRWLRGLTASVFLFAAVQTPAFAQSTRTWVSSAGDDANACDRTAPCRTFSGVYAKTSAGGEISVLDPGEYGSLIIYKSLTINNASREAGVVASGGITIQAGPADRIVLRGLTLPLSSGSQSSTLYFITGASLLVENCHLGPTSGITFWPTGGTAKLTVRNTTVYSSGGRSESASPLLGYPGILIHPTDNASATVALDNVRMVQNYYGIIADSTYTTGSISMSVRDSEITGSEIDGILAKSKADRSVKITLEGSTVMNNGFGYFTAAGVEADGTGALVRIRDSVISENRIGIRAVNGGIVESYGGNIISGNSSNGAFSSTQKTQ
jgi:hypothetical protein